MTSVAWSAIGVVVRETISHLPVVVAPVILAILACDQNEKGRRGRTIAALVGSLVLCLMIAFWWGAQSYIVDHLDLLRCADDR